MYRRRGEICLLRYRRRGPISYAYPTTVVEDRPERTSLYLQPGTPIKCRQGPNGQPFPRNIPYREQVEIPFAVGDGVWTSNHVLILAQAERAHDIRLFWSEEDWIFRGWYINLQQPLDRILAGFDTADHVLDLFVEPDGSWRWKDEDEFAIAVEIGRFTEQEAVAIRAEGEKVIADIEAGAWPFDAGFEHWRPDPEWEIPAMPVEWDRDDD